MRFTNTSKSTALTVGGKAVKIPLVDAGPSPSAGTPPVLNVNETYNLTMGKGDRRGGTASSVTNAAGGGTTLTKPVDNIGDKTFGGAGNYATYANQYIYNVTIPGCATAGKVFVGQRKEPFNIAVGKVFDLSNINPLGPGVGGNNNDLEAKNVSTLALELPISCITADTDQVVGAWTTASLRQGRLLSSAPKTGLNDVSLKGGAWTQVSRLGNPLVDEVVIPTRGQTSARRSSAAPRSRCRSSSRRIERCWRTARRTDGDVARRAGFLGRFHHRRCRTAWAVDIDRVGRRGGARRRTARGKRRDAKAGEQGECSAGN